MAVRTLCSFDTGSLGEAQWVSNTATVSVQSTVVKNGGYALRVNTSNSQGFVSLVDRNVSGYAQFGSSIRFYFRINTMPTNAINLFAFFSGASEAGNATGTREHGVWLNADRTLSIHHSVDILATSTQTLTTGVWYLVELDALYNNNAGIRLLVDGTIWAAHDTYTFTIGNKLFMGCLTNTTADLYYDEIIIRDDRLPVGRPSSYALTLMRPNGDSYVGTGWGGADGGSVNLFDSLDNVPPIGSTTNTAGTRIRNATNTTTGDYDATFPPYSTLIPANHDIEGVQPIANHAQGVTTGGNKSGALTVTYNPADSGGAEYQFSYGAPNFSTGSDTAPAMGTHPTGWATSTGFFVSGSTISRTNGSVVRVGKRSGGNREVSVDQLGLYVYHYALPVPETPTNVKVTGLSEKVRVRWDAMANATSYQVLRNGTQVYSGTATSYADTSVTVGTSYSYQVRATSAGGSSAYSTALAGTPYLGVSARPISVIDQTAANTVWTTGSGTSQNRYDDFNRADTTTGLGTSPDGTGWLIGGTATVGTGDFKITNNRAAIYSKTSNVMLALKNAGTMDVDVQVRVFNTAGSGSYDGLAVNADSAGDNIQNFIEVSAVGTWAWINGTWSQVTEIPTYTIDATNGTVVRAVRKGDTFTVYVNGTQIGSSTRADLPKGTYHGFLTETGDSTWDDFSMTFAGAETQTTDITTLQAVTDANDSTWARMSNSANVNAGAFITFGLDLATLDKNGGLEFIQTTRRNGELYGYVDLMQGTTKIATETIYPPTGSFSQSMVSFDSTHFAAITDWSAVRVRYTMDATVSTTLDLNEVSLIYKKAESTAPWQMLGIPI